jgi:hypothetical protein
MKIEVENCAFYAEYAHLEIGEVYQSPGGEYYLCCELARKKLLVNLKSGTVASQEWVNETRFVLVRRAVLKIGAAS